MRMQASIADLLKLVRPIATNPIIRYLAGCLIMQRLIAFNNRLNRLMCLWSLHVPRIA